MPWDASRICRRGRRPTACAGVVAGGDDVAVGQPRFSPDGDALAFVAEATVGWNVWLAAARRRRAAAPLLDEPHEHAEPAWGPGQRSFAWSPDGAAIVLNRNEDGFGRLVSCVDLRRRRVRRSRSRRAGTTGSTGARRDRRASARAGAPPPQLTVLDPRHGARAHVGARGAPAELDAVDLPEPEPVTWAGGDGATVARAAVASRPRRRPGAGALPPLLVDVHGGPTDQATVDWKPRGPLLRVAGLGGAAARTTAGSTGYGRAVPPRARPDGGATLDVADTAAGIRAAATRRLVRRRRASR